MGSFWEEMEGTVREWQEEAEGKGKKQVQKARAEGKGRRSGPCHLARKSTKKISEDQVNVIKLRIG